MHLNALYCPNMDINQTIHDIEERADRANVPMSVLCKKAGIHQTTWWRWKAKKVTPTKRHLYRLLRVAPERAA